MAPALNPQLVICYEIFQFSLSKIPANFKTEFKTFYCIEGTEMRQLGFKVRRLLFLNRY